MLPYLPICSSPDAYRLLSGQLPSINSPDALLQGAVAVAMHQCPTADIGRVDQTLQKYVDVIRARVRGSQPQALWAHMHEYLFEDLKFSGNTLDYYNPANSYLPAVLETKLGLPITLSLVYKVVAERLGFRCWGVGLPGHFLCGIEVEGARMLIDPFAQGRIMTSEEAQGRMQEIFGEDAEWSEDLLRPASNRHWLTRMLQNLLNIFGSSGAYQDVAAMLEMEILLWPEQMRLQRDLALVLARLGMAEPASKWLDNYLRSNPDDPQCGDLKQLLEVLSA
ncbi:MAG TPA: transglutaminase-like domain-containing protein [Tepidisphaeraceae bacterium]|nr:transglutaminase-like domain-containing protein [Tepidisphaeraceae bacterium]